MAMLTFPRKQLPSREDYTLFCLELYQEGRPGGSAVERLPLAQGVIPESRGRVPHRASGMEPAFLSACVSISLPPSFSRINK